MDFVLFFQAILALIFVVGLVLVFFWFVKFCNAKGCKNLFFKKLNISNRLSVVETRRLDARNSLVLAKCDDKEYLILVGVNQSQVLNSMKADKNV